MANWSGSDWAIFGVAAFIAVSALVRLMVGRRNSLLAELEQRTAEAQRKKQAADVGRK